MNKFINYIDRKYSKEFKLLILLSQDELEPEKLLQHFSDINWNTFLELVIKHKLVSQIHKNIHILEKMAPYEVLERIKQYKIQQTQKALNYMSFAINIHQCFAKKSIPHCFFKGLLLSQEIYGDIGFRSFSDLDLLVDIRHIEEARRIIEELGFTCINPDSDFSAKQRKINYSLSHHYFFRNETKNINVELHWNISNPQSFFNVSTNEILSSAESIFISGLQIPYLSRGINLVYLASHGSVHQWYRLFWLKDFSVLLSQTNVEDLKIALELSQKLKLETCFHQACLLANLFYKAKLPDFFQDKSIWDIFIRIPVKSIHTNELKFRGSLNKVGFVVYKLLLKRSAVYYWDLLFRLRTHPTDWAIIRLPDKLFPLYYVFRPFLLIYRNILKKRVRHKP